jgi:hypothetical protein
MSPRTALNFVEKHGVVLESAGGPVPNLAEAIAGERIRGSWWGHEKGKEIFRVTRLIRASSDVLVCRLIDGKVTYVHRRLWPALLRLAGEICKYRTNVLHELHRPTGQHKVEEIEISRWLSQEVRGASAKLSRADAIAALPNGLNL